VSCTSATLSTTPTGKEAAGVNDVRRSFKGIVEMIDFFENTEVKYGYFSAKGTTAEHGNQTA
jgi:hypothetical protein